MHNSPRELCIVLTWPEKRMTATLSERLRWLGVLQGARHLRPRRRVHTVEELLPAGQIVRTEHGPFFLLRRTYGAEMRHGIHALGEFWEKDLRTAAHLARDERLADAEPERIAFIDIETTGLGGAGACAFLIGVGMFETGRFVVHQFFMRDYGEEQAQLQAVGDLLGRAAAVVSFNGKGFDLPFLENRFILTRRLSPLDDVPHLDLLPAARRLWKHRLSSCTLSSLEREVLGVRRSRRDVPGWLIPYLYADYVRSGDARRMPDIFYHNAQDILSLVTLAVHICDLIDTLPEKIPEEDLYGLGRIWQEMGRFGRAEWAWSRAAVAGTTEVRRRAMRDLALLLKRQERRSEAVAWWQHLAEAGSAWACEELAKHYEWHDVDLQRAITWARRGLDLSRGDDRAAFVHRLARLERKCGSGPTVT